MKNWQHYWKAILTFLTLVATNAATDLMQSGNPWPSTGGDWARWGVSIVGGTLVVYGKGNAEKRPVDDADAKPQPVIVLDEPVEEAAVPTTKRRLPVI